jgi:lipopolysaccharide transport system permease protein
MTVKIYVPETRFNAGLVTAMRALASELFQYRSHIAILFSSDFKSSYRGTVLGVFWNLVLPIVPVSVYLLLVTIRVFPSYESLPPAIFIGTNVMLWYLFTGLITRSITVVKQQAAVSMKTSLPLSASIAASFAQLTFDSIVRLSLLFLLVCYFGVWPSVNVPGALVAVFSSLIFCAALGLILSIVNLVYGDTERVTAIALQYGLFLSGVVFPVSAMGPLSALETYNPFCVFINALRDSLFLGGYANVNALMAWGAAGFIAFIVGVRFFYAMEHRVRGLV